MDSLISRQVAIDAISSMFAPTPTQKDMVEDCLEIIENLPSAQPEFIRCKDCIHYRRYTDTYMCGLNVLAYVREDDFCSRAERRTE